MTTAPEPAPGVARPTPVRTTTLAALALLLLLGACGTDGGTTARDDDGATGPPPPTRIPPAPDDVATRGVVTILDDGDGPELCLGPVAESWPPQCDGPPLRNWDWKRQRLVLGQPGGTPAHEEASGVRWGRYFLTGRWDGESFTVRTSVPEALHEQPTTDPPAPPDDPAPGLSDAELEEIARDLMGSLPGTLSSYVADGRAHVEVVYDDGSLQAWADARYGAGAVVVTPALVDVTPRRAPASG